jgi:phage terminase large subunit GpA-like protein
VFMKSARIGGTECGNNVLAYFIDQDPSSMLAILPTVDLAKGWSKEQLSVMIRDNPCLREKVHDPSSRDSNNTIQQKAYPGGILTIVGANSGAGFRMRSVRVLYGSEVDGWPESAGSEGDPVRLGIKRTETFANRKIYLESTPLLKGFSRIEAAYYTGDQRQYHVRCPDCEHEQTFVWGNLRYEGLPEPMYACSGCGVLIPEHKKYDMVARGRWVAAAPFEGTASFRINALYSPFDGARWPKLVKQWKESLTDNAQLQQFVNQVLGESWEIRGGKVDPVGLMERKEKYAAEVPQGVCVLVAGVDVQADRLELNVIGVGVGLETWRVSYRIFAGDTGHPDVWRQLDEDLFRDYRHESGRAMRIRTTCIDTGFHASESVYQYVRPRQGRRVIATKGSSTETAPLLPKRPTTNNKGKVRLYVIGTNAAKSIIYSRLKVAEKEVGEGGPLYCHFPAEDWADIEYFDQLTAEKAVQKQVNGRWVMNYVCPHGKRNEVLDTEVLALVAFELCGVPANRLEAIAKTLEPASDPVEQAASPAEKPSILNDLRHRRPVPKRGWVSKW